MIAFPRIALPTTAIALDVVRVNSSIFARVPGPADLLAMLATISAYCTRDTRFTAATIGIVAWPPQLTMFKFAESKCPSRLTTGTT